MCPSTSAKKPSSVAVRTACAGISEEIELEAGDAPASPRRQLRVRSHINGAPIEIATEFRNAILRKTNVGAKADTEMTGRLMLDAVVSGRLPHSAKSPVRIYDDQGLPYTLVSYVRGQARKRG